MGIEASLLSYAHLKGCGNRALSDPQWVSKHPRVKDIVQVLTLKRRSAIMSTHVASILHYGL